MKHLSRRERVRLLLMLAATIVTAGIATTLLIGGIQNRDEATDRNVDAIRVTCTLISNALIQSGAAGGNSQTAAAALTVLRLKALRREMTSAERVRADRLQAQLRRKPPVDLPDCDRVASDPGSVVAVPRNP